MVISRIAPTPSGYLHMGNGVNFLLTFWYVRQHGGRVILRIDDMDATRCRQAFVDDIFYTLEWLGIDIDEGPSGTEAFYRDYSMAQKMESYRVALETMGEATDWLYACRCSRKSLASEGPLYPQLCYGQEYALETHHSAMRMHVPEGTTVEVGDHQVMLDQALGDFVLWRKDGLGAYQFISVLEDRDLGVNTLIRGEDLLVSSAAQRYLAPYLKAEAFEQAHFIHHALVMGEDHQKLSKSEGAYALKEIRHHRTGKESVMAVARRLAQALAIDIPAR